MARRNRSLWTLLALCIAFPILGFSASNQPSIPADDKPIQIEGRSPRSGTLTRSTTPIPEDLASIEMLRDRLGVIAALDARAISSVNRLSRAVDHPTPQDGPPELFLHFGDAESPGVLEVYPDTDTVILQTQGIPKLEWTIRREAFDRLGIPLDAPAESNSDRFLPATNPLEITIPSPHIESDLVLDAQTIRSRLKNGFPSLTRVVGNETFQVRLPKDFNPQTPSGVLVFISPTPSGTIHESFALVCDELGLIAIGVDNNGNERPVTDRLQNHLDSIETLVAHARIDRERIYLTGMSGGGRCSGILQLAFPERFAGAVPIVGLDTYHNAPTGTPNQFWPKAIGKPSGKWMKLLQERRIRSITGSADFNEPEMVLRTELLKRDGVNAEIDVIEGMAHTYPNAKQFRDALVWVDEPRRNQIATQTAEARRVLDETKDQDTNIPAIRRKLIGVMESMPYTPEAWEAAARLGYPQHDD